MLKKDYSLIYCSTLKGVQIIVYHPPYLHRDLFSAVVAGQLCQDGYFGEEYYVYGFMAWHNGNVKSYLSSDEETCCRIYVDLQSHGMLLTPHLYKNLRIFVSSAEELKPYLKLLENDFKTYLKKIYPPTFQKFISHYQMQQPDNHGAVLLEEYLSGLTPKERECKHDALINLIAFANTAKVINDKTESSFKTLLPAANDKNNPDGNFGNTFSGFAWLNNDDLWNFYSNGFLPITVQKRQKLQLEGYLVSPVCEYSWPPATNKSVQILRQEFEIFITQIYDEAYLKVIKELATLPSIIDSKKLQIKIDKLGPLSIEAQQCLNICKRQWLIRN